eukprot:CAMPEP_0172547054 /NCGR_PEP_ID=MMETSP1067-20121228/16677_1 /TAXON_ID=265564 ORGANISM="Thalassiosira punctigera, Strain Tpunct2005C2" /NCGR_SAMPLE_ID=MMETSP1067 /ASSEMBLY_ACC=CAM_ASM_000444 /LENGTH=834 /DNA_ID=CAMNT_0013334075 /DNA_START=113 /DNA_END=2617 /DNA_ORIENTATION=+
MADPTPGANATEVPSAAPSSAPSAAPSGAPSSAPSGAPSSAPSAVPSSVPSGAPSSAPSSAPSAVPSSVPSSAPTRPALPIRPINVVVLTDVHSWVMGHGRGGRDDDGGGSERGVGVDLGHVLSFYQRLQERANGVDSSNGKPDLYLVMNGDFLHGTLLGADPPLYLSGILGRMPWDVVGVGEHELENADSLGLLRRPGGLFDEWGDRLVTSNARAAAPADGGGRRRLPGSASSSRRRDSDAAETTSAPLGENYRLLHGNQGTVLVLGFLYDLRSEEAVLTVEKVEDVLQEPWFTSLFDSKSPESVEFDAILVMAHMDAEDELITMLHKSLRGHAGPTVSIQFITGHTHRQAYSELDDYSSSFQAGRYLETVGYLSFSPGVARSTEHVFIDADQASLAQSLGMGNTTEDEAAANDDSSDKYPDWMTKDGMELSQYIKRTMEHSGAHQILGCSDKRYWADGGPDEANSLSRLYLGKVLPSSSYLQHSKRNTKSTHHHSSHNDKNEEREQHHAFIHYLRRSSPTVQYDLLPGVVTLNDIYGVVPLDDAIVTIGHTIRGDAIMGIVEQMNMNSADEEVAVVAVETGKESPTPIQNEMMYTLHTPFENIPVMHDAMVQLSVPAAISDGISSSANNGRPTRGLWIEFVQREWPYDGNGCRCLQEANGCRRNDTVVDYDAFVQAPPASGGGSIGGSSGGGGSGGSIAGSGEVGGGGTGGGEDQFGAGPTDAHGGKPTHDHHGNPPHGRPPSTPSNHSHHGQPKGGHHESVKTRDNDVDSSDMSVFWATIAAVVVFVFAVVRRPWQRRSTDVTNVTNDLELRESPPCRYSSPAMPSRGLYV